MVVIGLGVVGSSAVWPQGLFDAKSAMIPDADGDCVSSVASLRLSHL